MLLMLVESEELVKVSFSDNDYIDRVALIGLNVGSASYNTSIDVVVLDKKKKSECRARAENGPVSQGS